MTGTFTPNRYAGTLTTGVSASLNHTVLLTNGKVLGIAGGNSAWILEPDRKGVYLSGSWRRIADCPIDMLYGAIWTTNDGRVVFYGGEYGTPSSGAVFNVKTETWSSISGTGHAPSGMGDDGRVILNGSYIQPNATSPTTASGITPGLQEEPIVLLPSGKLAGFDSGSALQTVFVISPNYSAEYIAAGTSSGDDTTTRTSFTSTLTGFSDNGWNGQVGAAKNWCSNKNENPNYEMGAAFWMHKIGKLCLIGGDGYIYTYDPTSSTLARPAAIGWDFPGVFGPRFRLGSIVSADNGRTIESIRTTGTFTFSYADTDVVENVVDNFISICNGSVGFSDPRRYISIIRTEGSSFVMLKLPTATGTYATKNTIAKTVTITGTMVLGLYGEQTTAITVATGNKIDWGVPFLYAQDAPATILPNGNVLFAAGATDRTIGFTLNNRWLTWDGSSSTATNVPGVFSGPSFACEIYPLPDGSYFVKSVDMSGNGNGAYFNNTNPTAPVGYYYHYIPDSTEATPIAGSRPSLTSFPPTVEPSQTVFISGTGLTGVNEGGYFGDDRTPRTNFPIIRFTRVSDGDVYFGRTYNFSYRGIAPGRASTCYCDVPSNIPAGSYNVHVITNGIPSASAISVTVKSSGQQEGTSPILINPYQR